MCGIVGVFSFKNCPHQNLLNQQLIALMARRGPDDEGLWSDGQHCTLGFRRLAILDLSPTGHQPMTTRDERYVIVSNGEIYNFRELRHHLEQQGIKFLSSGDTEVAIYALAHWGIKALERFNGMFALGFYDQKEKRLLLARDYAGIKPLYYLHTSQGIVFASQYDQILAHPWSKNLSTSKEALRLYLQLGYIPAPYAILENTYMLEPGCWLEVKANGSIKQGRFFEFPAYVEPALNNEDSIEALDETITKAVQRHLISDVPVGTFLSGGIDSPLVTAKVNQMSQGGIKAFTISTDGDEFDETPDAIIYAKEIGIEHKIEHIKVSQLIDLLGDVVSACGEPFADYSIFPTMIISRIARQEVKVMLSGDGGDELFWGYYGRFASVLKLAEYFKYPYTLRKIYRSYKKISCKGDEFRNLSFFPTIGAWYRAKHTRILESWLKEIFPELPSWPNDFTLFDYSGYQLKETAQWMRWNEFIGHLTMVLLKVDRASMYTSLEVRVPLLDREVIDAALKLDWPTCLDMKNMLGKMPLRKILLKSVKHQTQQKRGFTVPMNKWLRGPFRKLFEEKCLTRKELLGQPINHSALQAFFNQHKEGQADYAWGLWVLLSLALWEEAHYKFAYL